MSATGLKEYPIPAGPLLRYGVAVVATAFALVFTLRLAPLAEGAPFLLFFATVMLSAWYGGLGPGLLASTVAVVASAYFLLPPVYSLAVETADDRLKLGFFALVAAVISVLTAQRQRAEEAERTQREYFQVTLASIGDAVEGAQRLQALIRDLLAYTRLDGRDSQVLATECEVVLGQVVRTLQLPIEETKALVTHDPLPVVDGDRSQLGLIFQNLISNALKFRGETQPRVHISARQDGSQWVFAVQDNGIGIDPRQAARIFEVFQRVHRRGQYPGTGMGLAICKKIVGRHGGRIWVESEPGKGATFYFTLPVVR